MINLYDLFDSTELAAAVTAKHVRIQNHPDLPIWIYNYTDMCMYDHGWNATTTSCRGLIADQDGNLLARPWAKFFNYGEHDAAALDLTAPVQVTDKKDGSLGILYPTGNGHAIATRGSFTSEQAIHATVVYQQRYPEFDPMDDITYLFEICYPANRIVLDYGDLDDLILLGAVHIDTGTLYGPNDSVCSHWPGPRTETYGHATLADALTATPRPNAEGLVIRYLDGPSPSAGLMLKIKQDDYIRAHALATRTSTTSVWEALAEGRTLIEDRTVIPDEFLAWVDKWTAKLTEDKDRYIAEANAALAMMPSGCNRKTFALAAIESPYRAALFRLLDGKEIDSLAWKSVKPDWEPARVLSEDVA